MRVIEKFISINGEGLKQGELSVFIRFANCNLRCIYCDTAYSYHSPKYIEESVSEIVDYILSTGVKNVTLTGGEPLLQYITKNDSIKFVCGTKNDLIRSKEIMDQFNLYNRTNCLISPVYGDIEPYEIVEFMKNNKMNQVRLQLQIHKIIWDKDKRGV